MFWRRKHFKIGGESAKNELKVGKIYCYYGQFNKDYYDYRVSQNIGPTLVFVIFSGSGGNSDLYSTALDICYIIATRISKIDLEIDN